MKKLTLEIIQKNNHLSDDHNALFPFWCAGFAYNSWRYEHNEYNNNVHTASFQMIQELTSLEQNIYANHYDHIRETTRSVLFQLH
jgi:hypothetical protein